MSNVRGAVARQWRALLGLVVALSLTGVCLLVATAAMAGPSMASMPGMAATSWTSATSATSASAGPAAPDTEISGSQGVPTVMLYDEACVSGMTQACAALVGLSAVSLLALVLATWRHTFLGLLGRGARQAGSAVAAPRRPPWLEPRPFALAVIRV